MSEEDPEKREETTTKPPVSATNAATDGVEAKEDVEVETPAEGAVLGFYSGGTDTAPEAAAVQEEGEAAATPTTRVEDPIIVEEGAIWEPAENDVLSGRGAHVNSHGGNKKFRALCFARKAQFEAGNYAAKRRVAVEIWTIMVKTHGSRFLRKRQNKGPWYEMTTQQAIIKAQQVMRDYKRPDRLLQRELMAASGRKRNRATATPMDDVHVPPPPTEPLVETPDGVNENDVLCGRGAFVNGHSGNQRLRKLAQERKAQFDASSYTEKRALATEIVNILRALEPPGRFLRQTNAKDAVGEEPPASEWEEVDQEKAIHKACQVMRDIDRPDRRDRDERRRLKKLRKEKQLPLEAEERLEEHKEAASPDKIGVEGGTVFVEADAADQQQAAEEVIAAVTAPTETEGTPTNGEMVTETV